MTPIKQINKSAITKHSFIHSPYSCLVCAPLSQNQPPVNVSNVNCVCFLTHTCFSLGSLLSFNPTSPVPFSLSQLTQSGKSLLSPPRAAYTSEFMYKLSHDATSLLCSIFTVLSHGYTVVMCTVTNMIVRVRTQNAEKCSV